MIVARRAAVVAVALVLAGCGSTPTPTAAPTPTATATSTSPQAAAPANDTGAGAVTALSALVPALPWDVAKAAAHEILCAYNAEGIVGGADQGGEVVGGALGTTAGCGHHVGVPGSTQDQDAIDLNLEAGSTVRAVAPGYVRWAGWCYSTAKSGACQDLSGPPAGATSANSWSCFGWSVAVDTPMADGSVVTALYAHLGALSVAAGATVKAGDTVATSGSSGGESNTAVCATTYPPHLHVGMYTNANYVSADGTAASAVALLAATTATSVPTVASPPYGGNARLPEGWADCSRTSLLATQPAGETASCTGLHAGDLLTYTGPGGAPVTPPTVVSGSWVAPKDGAKLTTSTLTLSAKPSVTPTTLSIAKVAFSVKWGSITKVACSATKSGSGGVWSCTADPWKLGAPLGKLTLSFAVTDSAGDVAKAPAGTRTVTFAAPPGAPSSLTHVCYGGNMGPYVCPEGGPITITWKSGTGTVAGYRLYWSDGSSPGSDGLPTAFGRPVLLATLGPGARSWKGAVTSTKTYSGRFSLVAFNGAGSSKAAVDTPVQLGYLEPG